MNASAALASHIGAGSGPGRILAIDYGQKRLGLALSDQLRVTAQPFATWRRSNRRRDLARLRDLCREQGVGLILVGLPMHLEGANSTMAAEASRFAELVRAEVGKPVELVDERLSSWEAEQALGENVLLTSRSRERRRHKLDEVAAAVILRDYLQTRRTSA
jgi:putative Holliday junction resolvase